MTFDEIHRRVYWPDVLDAFGVVVVPRRPMPCPACGGRDRFTFDDRNKKGDFLCRQCGPGDGFDLLRRVFPTWDAATAKREVMRAMGIDDMAPPLPPRRPPPATEATDEAFVIPARVRELVGTACPVELCPDVVAYLRSRALWPLPPSCRLRAHPAAPYWHDDGRGPQCVGRYPALVAAVRDVAGDLVTAHVTYIEHGQKLTRYPARKVLAGYHGRSATAQLFPIAGGELGIAEGIETALAAMRVHAWPSAMWAALSAGQLEKLELPADVETLTIFADRDVAGVTAAAALLVRLQGRVRVQIEVPRSPYNDWADVLAAQVAELREPGDDAELAPDRPWWKAST